MTENDVETACDNVLAKLARSLTVQLEKNDLIEKIEEAERSNEILRQKIKQIKESKDKLLVKREGVRQNLHLKSKDEDRMSKAKEFYEIGKSYTGIRWDYSALEKLSKGYISNKEKRVLQPFNLDRTIGAAVIEDKLWSLVEESASCDWSQFDEDASTLANKENFIDNK